MFLISTSSPRVPSARILRAVTVTLTGALTSPAGDGIQADVIGKLVEAFAGDDGGIHVSDEQALATMPRRDKRPIDRKAGDRRLRLAGEFAVYAVTNPFGRFPGREHARGRQPALARGAAEHAHGLKIACPICGDKNEGVGGHGL